MNADPRGSGSLIYVKNKKGPKSKMMLNFNENAVKSQ
jgi:hypothetical protein